MNILKPFLAAAICTAALSFFAVGCSHPSQAPMYVIYDTDMGNDVDDAMALDILYKYQDEGRIKLLAVMLNKVEYGAAEYVDLARTWYGYPETRIGIIKEGADCSHDAVNYAAAVADMTNEDGTPVYDRTCKDCSTLPLAVDLYREILSKVPDASVTIISTGFSSNLARLLDSQPDGYSKLTGKELVARKVKKLSIMAGALTDSRTPEYNVIKDIPAAQKVASEWPTELTTSPAEVGLAILYPGSSIEQDFKWTDHHPMVDGFYIYRPMPYDACTFDVTSVLYAIEGAESADGVPYFEVVGPGRLEFTDESFSRFTPDPEETRYYLKVDSLMSANLVARFKELVTRVPNSMQSK